MAVEYCNLLDFLKNISELVRFKNIRIKTRISIKKYFYKKNYNYSSDLPFIILVDLSVRVFGEEYPIGIPWTIIVFSDSNSKIWAKGRYPEKIL